MAGFGSMARDNSFGGHLPEPDWSALPPRWTDFSKSPNVDDRRQNSFMTNWSGALGADLLQRGVSMEDLKMMLAHPMTPYRELIAQRPLDSPINPLGVQAGMLDITRGHGLWLLGQRMREQQAIQADPNIHSFDEPLEDNAAPVRFDRRKTY